MKARSCPRQSREAVDTTTPLRPFIARPKNSSPRSQRTQTSAAAARIVHNYGEAALREPPTGAGDEMGPETVRTKAEILDYLNGAFEHLARAIASIGDKNAAVKSSPISPLKSTETTRFALTVEAMIHALTITGKWSNTCG
jgi:hypothetical protein